MLEAETWRSLQINIKLEQQVNVNQRQRKIAKKKQKPKNKSGIPCKKHFLSIPSAVFWEIYIYF